MFTQIFDDKMTPTLLSWHNIDRKTFKMADLRVYPVDPFFQETHTNYIWAKRARSTDHDCDL